MRVSSSSESESKKKGQKKTKSKKRKKGEEGGKKKDKGKKKTKDANSCSSSSSDSDSGVKKKDKKAKKHKKSAKEEGKQKRRAERAEAWDCDRAEASRLIRQLLEMEEGVTSELEGVFDQIDDGLTVDLNGLENKAVRKKLRHLLQSLGLVCIDGRGFRSADPKVMFRVVFDACLHSAGFFSAPKEVVSAPAPPPKRAASKPTAPPKAGADGPAAAAAAAFLQPPPVVEPAEGGPARKRIKGPQLPGASVEASAAGLGDESDSSADEGAGPLFEGEEREGVDLRDLPSLSQREQWMTTPHGEVAGAFGDAPAKKGDAFQVQRSAAETAEFERQFKRGPSLLEQTREGQVDGACREEAERLNGRQAEARDMWGASTKEQKSGRRPDERAGALKRPFDPDQDMKGQVRPMTGDQFQSLVENSQSALSGRFARSQVATSFL